MRIIDFEYDGILLSDLGFIPCLLNNSKTDTVDIGNKVDIGKVKSARNNSYYSIGANYSDVLQLTFSIVVDPCSNPDIELTDEQINDTMRWLNRRRYCKFKPIYEEGEFPDVYYNATFNAELVMAGTSPIGFNLTFITNAPYGFKDVDAGEHELSAGSSIQIEDESIEIGYVYADMEITVNGTGTLEIINDADKFNKTVIENCEAGDKIIFNGRTKEISSENHVTIANDFNYRFPRVTNTYNNKINNFSFNLPCSVKINYTAISKVGIIL